MRRENEIQIISKGELGLIFMEAVKSSGKYFLRSRVQSGNIRMEQEARRGQRGREQWMESYSDYFLSGILNLSEPVEGAI